MIACPATPAHAKPPLGAVRLQIAFLTGPVSPHSSALSPQQLSFLARLPRDPAIRCINRDFPYTDCATAWQPTPLWRASLGNATNFLRARSPAFAAAPARRVCALLEQADHTLFLAGSCGLELFAGLHLPRALLCRTSLLAYGPVARRPFPRVAELRIIRGTTDIFAAITRMPADLVLPCGHLGYLARPEFAAWCSNWITRHLAHPTHAATI
jgi:hypothetical protein